MLRDDFKTQPPVDRQFRPVVIVLNNDNHLEPDGTAGGLAVGFEVSILGAVPPLRPFLDLSRFTGSVILCDPT